MKKFLDYALAVSAAVVLTACLDKTENKTEKIKNKDVFVQKPQMKKIEVWDNYTARLEGEKSVEIRSRVSGYLEKIFFDDGDYVQEGDILFQIDPAPFQAVVDACAASVAEIEAKIELAKSNLERAKQLYKENAISKEVLETRNSELLEAKAVMLSAKAKQKEATLNLQFTKILAPISGYIGKRRVDAGNLVSNAQTLMATLVARDTIYAYFEISERDVVRYSKINLFKTIDPSKRKGPPVRLRLMDETDFSHTGVLTYVDNKLDAASIELRAEIDNRDEKLFPGMFGKIELRAGEPQDKILVPEEAVGTDLIGRYVIVVNKDNTAHYRPVKVGEKVGKMIVVESGLKLDESIVVNGLHRAQPESKVNPIFKAEKRK